MNRKQLMIETDTSERELKEMTINRLITNDFESERLFLIYIQNQEEGYEDTFEIFLSEFYKDLGTDYDDNFEDIEIKILENIYNNNYYLD